MQVKELKTNTVGNEIRYYDRNYLYNLYRKDEDKVGCNLCYAIYEYNDFLESHTATFKTLEQLENFSNLLGFDFTFDGKRGKCSKVIKNNILGVTDAENEKPENARYLWSLSNGSIVKNWFISNDEEIIIHRINPNNKKYYKPIPLDKCIEYEKTFGSF